MRRSQEPSKFTLQDLIPLNELQDLQDSFAEISNVGVRVVDNEGRPITTPSRLPSLCNGVLLDSDIKKKICGLCLPTFLGGTGIVDDDLSYECFPGLKNYLIPLKAALSATKSVIFGYMVLGPLVFMKRKSQEEFAGFAREAGIDPYALWNLVLELRVFSFKGIRSLIDMIESVTGRILDLAYGKLVMQKSILTRLSERSAQEPRFKSDDLKEFLELFLDLVMDMTRSTASSVMLLDPSEKRLIVRAAHGLPEGVVGRASLKLGEGIAGLVAQTKQSFLINDDSFDRSIADRLNKPGLFSSAIVPIRSHKDVYGVLNISSDRAAPVAFDESTVALLTKAAGLAGVALSCFK